MKNFISVQDIHTSINSVTWDEYIQIVLVISNILQIQGRRLRICKTFSRSLEQFFLTEGQNNLRNKILVPFLSYSMQNLDLGCRDNLGM